MERAVPPVLARRAVAAALPIGLIVALAACGPTDEPTSPAVTTILATEHATATMSAEPPDVIRVTPSPQGNAGPQPVITVTIQAEPEPVVTVTAEPEPVAEEDLTGTVRKLARGEGFILPGSGLTYAYGWSPVRDEYAYLGRTDSGIRLVVVDPVAGTSRIVSDDSPINFWFPSFAWSPDGEWIAVLSRGFSGPDRLAVYPRDGGAAEVSVSKPRILSLDWSPDSEFLLFSSTSVVTDRAQLPRGSRMSVLEVPSGVETVLGVGAYPSLSPDGTLVAFFDDEGLDETWGAWVLDPATDSRRPLSPEEPLSLFEYNGLDPNTEYVPAWSPDGTQIAFLAASKTETFYLTDKYKRHSAAYVVNSDGTNLRDLATETAFQSSWSPDGVYLRAGNSVRNASTLLRTAITGVTTDQDVPGGRYVIRGDSRSVLVYEWSGALVTAVPLPAGWHQDVPLGWSYDGKYYALCGTGPASAEDSQAIVMVSAPAP